MAELVYARDSKSRLGNGMWVRFPPTAPIIMTYKNYLSGISIAGVISWSAWFLVVLKLNPFESTSIALILFFLSLFFALICTFTIIGFIVRIYANQNEIVYQHISTSLRQAVLLSLCACSCLFLLVFGLLSWWSGLLLVAIVTLIEFYLTKEMD